MEKGDKGSTLTRMGVSGWMFLLVPVYPGCPGQTAVKWLLFQMFIAQIFTKNAETEIKCILRKVNWAHIMHTITLGRKEADDSSSSWHVVIPVLYSPMNLSCLCVSMNCLCNNNQQWHIQQEYQNSQHRRHFVDSLYQTLLVLTNICLQCFDAVGWAAGRASGL